MQRIVHAQVVGITEHEDLQRIGEALHEMLVVHRQDVTSITTAPNIHLQVIDVDDVLPITGTIVRGAINLAFIVETAHSIAREFDAVKDDPEFVTPWSELSDEWRAHQVQLAKRCLRFNALTGPEMHARWAQDHFNDGWKYGPEFDRESKVHPGLVPFDQLPASRALYLNMLASTLKALRSKLPQPRMNHRPIEIYDLETATFKPTEFMLLYPGALVRFTDTEEAKAQCFQVETKPYINYLDDRSEWAVDASLVECPPIKVTKAEEGEHGDNN